MNIYHDIAPINSTLRLIITYRYVAFILAAGVLWIDRYYHYELNLFFVYTMVMILLGSIYKNNAVLLLQSGLVALTRYVLDPSTFDIFLSFWFTFFIFGFTTSLMISNYINQNKSNIELTKTLVKLLDSRDPYTATHSENVANYSKEIAKQMKLSKKKQNTIYMGGLLHDIGKIVIPESIVNKPDKLTEEEFDIIKQHPIIGYNAMKHIQPYQDNGH